MAISAKELSRIINVSEATISMVMNHKSGISRTTIDKVLEGAVKYGYDISRYYQTSSETKNICFLTYKKSGKVVTNTPFFAELTEGISNACKMQNVNLSLDYIYSGESVDGQLAVIDKKGYSGLILLATEMEQEDFVPFTTLDCPLLLLDSYCDNMMLDCVMINNVQGAYTATDYLVKQGFTRIGYLKSSLRIANFHDRADGFYKVLRHHNIKKDDSLVLPLSPSMEGAYEDMKHHLECGVPLADAYFADNDWIAAGAMRALTEAGIKIPDDVSIIGFDDVPICSFLSTPLTTMHVHKHDLGALAVEQLLHRFNSVSKSSFKIELAPTLTVRNSVSQK